MQRVQVEALSPCRKRELSSVSFLSDTMDGRLQPFTVFFFSLITFYFIVLRQLALLYTFQTTAHLSQIIVPQYF